MTRLLRTYLHPYRRQIAIVVVLLVAQTAGNLYLPNLMADIINDGVITGNLHYIVTTGALMLGITLGLGVVAVIAVYWASRTAMGAGADIRAAVFSRVQAFSARDMDRFGTPSLVTRNTNDVQQIQLFVQMALTLMVIAPIMCVGGIVLAVKEGAALSPMLAVAVPVMAIFIGTVVAKVVPEFRKMQAKIDRVNQVLREQITGVRVIRAFVRNGYEAGRFADANADLTATALRVNRVFALALPALMAILNLSSVAVLWFGGRLVSEGSMPIGNLTAFLNYIAQILMSVMMAVMMAILAPRAVASAERVQQVLNAAPSITDPPTPRRPPRGQWPGPAPGRRFRLPGQPGARPPGRVFCCSPRPDERHRRRHGQREDHLALLDPTIFRHNQRQCAGKWARCPRAGARGAVGLDRPRTPGRVPVQRHRRQQLAVREARSDRRRTVARPRGGPGL